MQKRTGLRDQRPPPTRDHPHGGGVTKGGRISSAVSSSLAISGSHSPVYPRCAVHAVKVLFHTAEQNLPIHAEKKGGSVWAVSGLVNAFMPEAGQGKSTYFSLLIFDDGIGKAGDLRANY